MRRPWPMLRGFWPRSAYGLEVTMGVCLAVILDGQGR